MYFQSSNDGFIHDLDRTTITQNQFFINTENLFHDYLLAIRKLTMEGKLLK